MAFFPFSALKLLENVTACKRTSSNFTRQKTKSPCLNARETSGFAAHNRLAALSDSAHFPKRLRQGYRTNTTVNCCRFKKVVQVLHDFSSSRGIIAQPESGEEAKNWKRENTSHWSFKLFCHVSGYWHFDGFVSSPYISGDISCLFRSIWMIVTPLERWHHWCSTGTKIISIGLGSPEVARFGGHCLWKCYSGLVVWLYGVLCSVQRSEYNLKSRIFKRAVPALPTGRSLVVVTQSLCVCMWSLLVELAQLNRGRGGGNSTATKFHQTDFWAILENFENLVELAWLNSTTGGGGGGNSTMLKMVFSDLRRPLVEREHYRQPLSKVCQQQFLYENGTQLCSYLVCRFVFDQGLGTRKEIDWNGLLVIWQCSNFSCLGLLTEAQITRAPWSYVYVISSPFSATFIFGTVENPPPPAVELGWGRGKGLLVLQWGVWPTQTVPLSIISAHADGIWLGPRGYSN